MANIEVRPLPPAPQRFKVLCGGAVVASLIFGLYKFYEGLFQGYPFGEAVARAAFYPIEVMFVITLLLMAGYIIWCSYVLTDRNAGFAAMRNKVRYASLGLLVVVATYTLILSGDLVFTVIACVFSIALMTALQALAYFLGWVFRSATSRKKLS